MKKIKVKPGTLIIMSGASGSGKSTLASQWSNIVISSDKLRQTLFGNKYDIVDGVACRGPSNLDDKLIFSTMYEAVARRMRSKMTTIVDATNLNDKARSEFAKLAIAEGNPVKVVIFKVELQRLLDRQMGRNFPVPAAVVTSQVERLQLDSKYDYDVVTEPFSAYFDMDYDTLPHNNIDVIGDVHGLYDDLLLLLGKLGYNKSLEHKQGRKLLFLGDYIDRGVQSLQCLQLVMKAVEKGHYCLLANHELNLLRGIENFETRSNTTRLTLHEVLQLPEEEVAKIKSFFQSLPLVYKWDKYYFCHADVGAIQYNTKFIDCVKGIGTYGSHYDSDKLFAEVNTDNVLIRGHIAATSKQDNVVSLDEGAGFGGPICAYQLDTGKLVRQETEFVYRHVDTDLEKHKAALPKKSYSEDTYKGITILKYNSAAFHKWGWAEHPILLETRGVCYGLDGKRITNSFPKLFNVWEPEAPVIEPDTIVRAVEKVNGYLAQCFWNPYTKSVQFTSSGKLNSEHANLAQSIIYSNTTSLYNYCRNNPTHTLMFEVITDKLNECHPIEYPAAPDTAYLIGCGTPEGFMTEDQLDDLANKTLRRNYLMRPNHALLPFKDALTLEPSAGVRYEGKVGDRYEGVMIRDAVTEDYLCKSKTVYYLTVKAFMRRYDEKNPANPKLTQLIQLQWSRKEWEMMSGYDRRRKVNQYIRDFELSQLND